MLNYVTKCNLWNDWYMLRLHIYVEKLLLFLSNTTELQSTPTHLKCQLLNANQGWLGTKSGLTLSSSHPNVFNVSANFHVNIQPSLR